MMTLFLLVHAFLPQLHGSGNQSMGFPLVTALVLLCDCPWILTSTSEQQQSVVVVEWSLACGNHHTNHENCLMARDFGRYS